MNELEQITFDYSLVSEEQASQLQTIYNRVLIRHMAKTYEDGKDLLEAQNIKGLSYDAFITWAASVFGWSRKTIDNKMNAALYWGDFTAPGAVEEHAVYLLSSKRVPETAREEAKQRASDGEKITEEVARKIRDAHRAKEQAEEAERKAKEQAQSAQQQLFTVQSQAQTKIEQLRYKVYETYLLSPEYCRPSGVALINQVCRCVKLLLVCSWFALFFLARRTVQGNH